MMANEKRLIDANLLVDVCKEIAKNEWNKRTSPVSWSDAYEGFIDDVDGIPTVDAVEVVHGHWYEHHGITICSRCQSMFDTDLKMLQVPSTWKMPNYCPNCGAYMRDGYGNG